MKPTSAVEASLSREALPGPLYSAGIRVTVVGMAVNVLLIVLKLVAGIAGSSLAMIADALHSASDLLTDFGTIAGLVVLRKPADDSHPYGHGRLETAISLGISAVIVLTGFGIGRNAVGSISGVFRGVIPEMPGRIALVMGLVSIALKEALYQYTRLVARRSGSRSLHANAWHHRTDALSSVAVVLGITGAIVLGNRWTILDPIAAGLVSLLVIKVGIDIGLGAFRELSDESLSRDRCETIGNAIDEVTGVQGHHHLRTRSLGRYVSIDAHILVDPALNVRDSHDIATQVERTVRKTMGNAAFINIHVEPGNETRG